MNIFDIDYETMAREAREDEMRDLAEVIEDCEDDPSLSAEERNSSMMKNSRLN